MGGIRRSDAPTEVSSPQKTTHVGFAETLVTGVTRPISRDEHWALWFFEAHAAKCSECKHPDEVQKAGKKLCKKGFELGEEVASLLFRLKRDGSIYCRSSSEHQEVRVEVPSNYHHVIGLLKAIRRSGNGFLEEPRSYDKNYFVKARQPSSRPGEVKPLGEPVTDGRKYNTYTVEPSLSPRGHPRKPALSESPPKVNRGSLYEKDILALEEAELRERRLRYNLEIRDPYRRRTAAS